MFRFLFWFIASVIMAYFMTDIRIGGKNIKEIIDGFLSTQSGIELKHKAQSILDSGLGKIVNQVTSPDLSKKGVTNPPQPEVQPSLPVNGSPDSDDLRAEDERKLQEIIKKHD